MTFEQWITGQRERGQVPFGTAYELFSRKAFDAGVAAERERCAKLCEGMHPEDGPHAYAWTIRTEWAADSDGA